MAAMFIAYLVTNLVNGKCYIGITTRALAKRWAGHRHQGRGRIGAAIRKYGAASFTIEHIASARTLEDLLALERLLIVQYDTIAPKGYNLCAGGEGVFQPSEETRLRMSAVASAQSRGPVSDETKAKIAAALRGHGFSPEALEKMRAAKLGGKATTETKALLSSLRKGRKLPKRTPEQIERMRIAVTGKKQKPRSAEHCAKISAMKTGRPRHDLKGKPRTEAAKAAIREGWTRRKAILAVVDRQASLF